MRTEIDDHIDDVTEVRLYAIDALVKTERALRATYDSTNDVLGSDVQDKLLDVEEYLIRVAYACFEELSRLQKSEFDGLSRLRGSGKENGDVRPD